MGRRSTRNSVRIAKWLETGHISFLDELEDELLHVQGKYTTRYQSPRLPLHAE